MRLKWFKRLVAASTIALAAGLGSAGDLNEVGALLVYPIVVGLPGQETLLTITNTSPEALIAHVAFVDGLEGTDEQPNPNYCNECNLDVYLTGNDTELIVIRATDTCETEIKVDDANFSVSCPQSLGMVVVSISNEMGETQTDNVLLGTEVVVDYNLGQAFSLPAISVQGRQGDGNREYRFDDVEYARFPRIIAANFLPPDPGNIGPVSADLALFTLGFDRAFPPVTDCSLTGFDAHENPLSTSFTFGCWTLASLWNLSPELAYPSLGYGESSSHGWLQLSCKVDSDDDGTWDAQGGVHGAIVQTMTPPMVQRPPFNGTPGSGLTWGRLLNQSVTAGDAVTFRLGAPGSMY